MKPEKIYNKLKESTKDVQWTTALGDKILLKKMEDGHLRNTIVMLYNGVKCTKELGLDPKIIYDKTEEEWLKLFRMEYFRRKEKVKINSEYGKRSKIVEHSIVVTTNKIVGNPVTILEGIEGVVVYCYERDDLYEVEFKIGTETLTKTIKGKDIKLK